MNGKAIPTRGTLSVIREQGSGALPFLLSRPQLAQMNMVAGLGKGRPTVALNNSESTLRTEERGGHMSIPMVPNAAAIGAAQRGSSDAVKLAPQDSSRTSAQRRRRVRCRQKEVAFATDGAAIRHVVQGAEGGVGPRKAETKGVPAAECGQSALGAALWAVSQAGKKGGRTWQTTPKSPQKTGPELTFPTKRAPRWAGSTEKPGGLTSLLSANRSYRRRGRTLGCRRRSGLWRGRPWKDANSAPSMPGWIRGR